MRTIGHSISWVADPDVWFPCEVCEVHWCLSGRFFANLRHHVDASPDSTMLERRWEQALTNELLHCSANGCHAGAPMAANCYLYDFLWEHSAAL